MVAGVLDRLRNRPPLGSLSLFQLLFLQRAHAAGNVSQPPFVPRKLISVPVELGSLRTGPQPGSEERTQFLSGIELGVGVDEGVRGC